MSKYHIRTYGCQMNEHDSERIAGLLEADGMTPAQNLEDADVVLFNTCCIRENADNKFYGNLSQLKNQKLQNPDLLIAVAGCLAQKDRDLISKRADFVDVVFGTHNIHRAPELLKYAREHGPIVEILEETVLSDQETFPSFPGEVSSPGTYSSASDSPPSSLMPVPKRDFDYKAWVTIQIGCDNSCAFCIVPSVRGPEISRSIKDIVHEVEGLASNGVQQITLLGQNVNSYGRDIALKERQNGNTNVRVRPQFSELLGAVSKVDGIKRVRYTSPHPKDLLPETIRAMAEIPEVCEHLHLPLQSGSNKILSAMHRGYSAEKFLDRLGNAKSQIPDLAVTTDIIVGFPGETEDDFEATLEVAATAEFDSAYSFIFSPREGTEAAQMEEDFIDPQIISDRFERLQIVLKRSAFAKHRERVGRIEEVLVEGTSPKDPTKATGRTKQNKLVHWSVTDKQLLPGTLANVEIVSAAPYFLRGELKEILFVPSVATYSEENSKEHSEPNSKGNAVRVAIKSPSNLVDTTPAPK